MDILDDMGVSKLSAKVFFLKWTIPLKRHPKMYFTHPHIVPNMYDCNTIFFLCIYSLSYQYIESQLGPKLFWMRMIIIV